jgi:leucyl aminopeptidase
MNGKTIEVINTDAEGRLILADGLAYACEIGATHIIDVATLTGAKVIAIGNFGSALMTNNQEWCDRVLEAGEATGEKLWQLPMWDEFKEQIRSDVADMKNTGGRPAGAITAALLLREFVEDRPWVHIDIAAADRTSKDQGWQVKGATGVPVRTLVKLTLELAASQAGATTQRTLQPAD